MTHVTINGKEYAIPEVDFDTICQLEENGVYLLNMDRKNPKIATMVRGIVAWVMDVEPERASAEIQAHIQNGGNIGDIITAASKAVTSSGFFRRNPQESTQKTVPYEGNREQRRRNKKNRNNTPASRRS